MSHPFQNQLASLREMLLLMATLSDRSLTQALQALTERDDSLARDVVAGDSEVDQLEIAIDEKVVTYMATHGPIARDARLMLTASKISSNLERIADQATTIARRALALNSEPQLAQLTGISQMAQLARQMLYDAVTAFVEGQYQLARDIIPRDKEVDELYRRVAKELTALMMQSPANVERAIDLLTIAKALERAADHAQNVAEEVFYLYKGENIRHEK